MLQQSFTADDAPVRLSQSAVKMGKLLAESQYGNETEIGRLLEELITEKFSGRENSGGSAVVPLAVVEKLAREMDEKLTCVYKALAQKSADLGSRLASLMTIANFESTLSEQLLRDKHYQDEWSRKTYEVLRKNCLQTTLSGVGDAKEAKLLAQRETIRDLEVEIARLRKEMETVKQKEDDAQNKSLDWAYKYDKAVKALDGYDHLVQWYEKLVHDVPVIRKKNSGFILEQSWEGALAEFLHYHPKPDKPLFRV